MKKLQVEPDSGVDCMINSGLLLVSHFAALVFKLSNISHWVILLSMEDKYSELSILINKLTKEFNRNVDFLMKTKIFVKL